MTLEQVREDYPTLKIERLLSVVENKYGFHDATVEIEINFFITKGLKTKQILPYPASSYLSLPEDKQEEYRTTTMLLFESE